MLIERYVKGKEDDLIDQYISHGPSDLKKELGVTDEEWTIIFDYLVVEKNLIYKCVMRNSDFFTDIYVKFGASHVRKVLEISVRKYDIFWEASFDFIAIANEGLYLHVLENRGKYMIALKARGADYVRKVLGIWKPKYEENWARILNLLLHAVCDGIFSNMTFEHGLKSFSMIMNSVREHRRICESGIL